MMESCLLCSKSVHLKNNFTEISGVMFDQILSMYWHIKLTITTSY